MEKSEFLQYQSLPYKAKVIFAERRAKEFAEETYKRGLNTHVSVGGLDSITLALFLRSIGIDVPAVSVSSLEHKSNQEVHKLIGVEEIKPPMSKVEVIREFGYQIISKDSAKKIEALQNPTEDNKQYRHLAMTGIKADGEKSKYGKLSNIWLNKFAGLMNEEYGTSYGTAKFKVSARCCYYIKEKPLDEWAKDHNSVPYMGLMAVEGGHRTSNLIEHGCNYYGSTMIRSCPFAVFTRQDLLRLSLDLAVPVPWAYGVIACDEHGILRTTEAQRTGCSICGFGIHLEKRPHRFDRMYYENKKEWEFWIYDQGWGAVLDYIGVGWTPWSLRGQIEGQIELEGLL